MSPARSVTIDGRRIAADTSPYVIAEMSGNHNQSLDRAMALVEVETLTDNFKLDLSAEAVTVHRISDVYVEVQRRPFGRPQE